MLGRKTIQRKLFFSYSILIAGIIVLFVIAFYTYTSRMLENKASESIQQLSNYISAQLDGVISNMDRISMEVVFSEALQENFFKDLSGADDAEKLYNQRELNKILYSILGPWLPPVRQINLFNLDGRFIGIGTSSMALDIPPSKIKRLQWLEGTFNENGKKYIVPPHKDDWNDSGNYLISLSRVLTNTYGLSEPAVVEVQQNYSIIPGIIQNALGSNESSKKAYVFDSHGIIIYPLEDSNNSSELIWNEIKSSEKKTDTFILNNSIQGEKEIMTFTRSEDIGWTVALIESEKLLLSPVIAFRNAVFVAGIGLLLITLLVSFFVARALTNPIKHMHHSIKSMSLQTLSFSVPDNLNSNLNELEELNISFNDMCARLKSSLEEVVLLRSHEIQARMLALQSQMNPHFIYNTIANISAMADEKEHHEIVEVCDDLTSLLRYISSESMSEVALSNELDCTVSYLNLMKKRYGDKLNYWIDIPEEMTDMKVPKLIIQPVVENCTKYGIDTLPPWEIFIEGRIHGGFWNITIKDNGPGFPEDKLASIKDRLASLDINKVIQTQNLNGMGLINIFSRLKLKYGENALFEVANHPKCGAVVTVGGIVAKEQDAV